MNWVIGVMNAYVKNAVSFLSANYLFILQPKIPSLSGIRVVLLALQSQLLALH